MYSDSRSFNTNNDACVTNNRKPAISTVKPTQQCVSYTLSRLTSLLVYNTRKGSVHRSLCKSHTHACRQLGVHLSFKTIHKLFRRSTCVINHYSIFCLVLFIPFIGYYDTITVTLTRMRCSCQNNS